MKISFSVLTLILAANSANAAPAPWYLWQSKPTGERVCAQILAGDWQQVGGPFEDSRCETLATRDAVQPRAHHNAPQSTATQSAP